MEKQLCKDAWTWQWIYNLDAANIDFKLTARAITTMQYHLRIGSDGIVLESIINKAIMVSECITPMVLKRKKR
jgi:hypothetical protein